jgi:hypothetical protein
MAVVKLLWRLVQVVVLVCLKERLEYFYAPRRAGKCSSRPHVVFGPNHPESPIFLSFLLHFLVFPFFVLKKSEALLLVSCFVWLAARAATLRQPCFLASSEGFPPRR